MFDTTLSLVVNQSISCAEHVGLIYYEVGHSLLQTRERITKCVNCFENWGKHNYKIGQLRIIPKGQKILKSGAVNPLQNGVIIIAQRSMYYKKGRFITVGPVLQIEARDIAKLGR